MLARLQRCLKDGQWVLAPLAQKQNKTMALLFSLAVFQCNNESVPECNAAAGTRLGG